MCKTKREFIPENKVENYLHNSIKGIGLKAYKFLAGGDIGVPDRMIPNPFCSLYVELKATDKRLRIRQKSEIDKIIKCGAIVCVIDDYEMSDNLTAVIKNAIESGDFDANLIDASCGRYYSREDYESRCKSGWGNYE